MEVGQSAAALRGSCYSNLQIRLVTMVTRIRTLFRESERNISESIHDSRRETSVRTFLQVRSADLFATAQTNVTRFSSITEAQINPPHQI